MLLAAPLFAYPLVWAKLFRAHVPYWDMAQLFGTSALALLAAAVLLAVGPSGVRRACGASGLARWTVVAAAVLWMISLARDLLAGNVPDPAEWFVFLVPLAGMVLSREILRILPLCGSSLLAVLAVFSCLFTHFTGLPGNWNWNLSLLAVLIPAPFLCFGRLSARRMWPILLLPLAAAAVFSYFRPELAPRGTIVGMAVALAAVWLLWKSSRRQRMIILCLGGGAGVVMFCSVWFGPADSAVRSSRVWLWRGSAELALVNSGYGVGMSAFERHIDPHLPKEYYFSDFAAERHPHPHNELLALWSGYGVAGAVFLALLFVGCSGGFRTGSAVRVWAFWMVLVMLIHGQFDVLLDTPLAGTLFWCVAGALAGTPVRGGRPHWIFGTAGLLVALFWAGLSFGAGLLERDSMFSSLGGDRFAARSKLEKSLAIFPRPSARYRAGMVALFDFKDMAGAIGHLEKLTPGYVHSNGLLARAWALRGDRERALEYFARETSRFPMSALNAFWELEVMRTGNIPPSELARRRARLNYLLKLRGLSVERIDELIRRPALDDAPLRNP